MTSLSEITSWVSTAWERLNKREKTIAGAMIAAIPPFLLFLIISEYASYIDDQQIAIEERTQELKKIIDISNRYQGLQKHYAELKNSFAEAQVTAQQVYTNLDNIVKKSVGAEKYDIKSKGEATEIGIDYQKQEYQLKIPSLSLDQLVKLLYEIEQGKSPLFLKKIDITSKPNNTFEATLEIYSVRKGES